jgi:glutathione S-transferase
MQLFTSPTTPFGRKVVVMILESGLSDRVELVQVIGTPLEPGTLPVAQNPLGKIPALMTDAGQAIFDSRVICRYLDAKSGAGLYPLGEALWPVLVLEATADGILDAAVLMAYELRLRQQDMQSQPWLEAQWLKISRALDAIEAQDMASLNGPRNMAQIAVSVALGYLDFRHDARGWRAGRPGLAAWNAEFAARPSMMATAPSKA